MHGYNDRLQNELNMGKYDISEDLKYAMLSYDLKGVSKFYFFT